MSNPGFRNLSTPFRRNVSPGDAEGTNPDKTMCNLLGASSDVLGVACKIP
eukprot:gene26888-biopygen17472